MDVAIELGHEDFDGSQLVKILYTSCSVIPNAGRDEYCEGP